MKHTQFLSAKILAPLTLFATFAAATNVSYGQPNPQIPKISYTITPADVVPAEGATFTIPTGKTDMDVHCSGKGIAKAEYADYDVKAELVLFKVVTNAQGQSSEDFAARPILGDQTETVSAGQEYQFGTPETALVSQMDATLTPGTYRIKYIMTAVFSGTGTNSDNPAGVESHTFTVQGAVIGDPVGGDGGGNGHGGH